MNKTKRTEWLDIYKGVAILLVVVGHATGLFNAFIYQFHMAAFFFISGYTTNYNKRSVPKSIYNDFLTLFLPLAVFFLGGVGSSYILNKFGLYSLFYNEGLPYLGVVDKIRIFFTSGDNYVWWLGAGWFLIVLLGIRVLHRIIYRLAGNQVTWQQTALAIGLSATGYYLIRNQIGLGLWIFSADLIFIGQLFFWLGLLLKQSGWVEKVQTKWTIATAGVALCALVLYGFSTIRLRVDYPSRAFGNWSTDTLAALNGCLFLLFLSILLVKVPKLKKVLICMGQNSLGIVLLHFMMFKVGYLTFVILGLAPLSYLSNFTNDASTIAGQYFWWIPALTGIGISLLAWMLLNRVRWVRILLGQDAEMKEKSYESIKHFLLECCKLQIIVDGSCRIWQKIRATFCSLAERCRVKNKNWYIFGFLAAICVICVGIPIIQSGIALNDELRATVQRFGGFGPMLYKAFSGEIRNGRAMRSLGGIYSALGFVSNSILLSRVIQYGILLLATFFLGLFVYRLWKSKRLAVLTGLLFLCFLPVTFEHAVPNAFNALCFFPFSLILASFSTYLLWLEKRKKLWYIFTMLLFACAMGGYEFLITYILMYPILYLARAEKEEKNLKNLIVKHIPLGLTAVLYLVGMVVFSSVKENVYTGTNVGFVSLASSAEILKVLFFSALPGYFCFNSKYRFLFDTYLRFPKPSEESGAVEAAKYFATLLQDWRVWLLVACLALLILKMLPKQKQRSKNALAGVLLTMLSGLLFMTVPALPNAISALYQGQVTESFFTSLPVSVFLYGAAVTVLGYGLWRLAEYVGKRSFAVFAAVILCMGVFSVQRMNTVFAAEHQKDYGRLQLMQDVLQSGVGENLQNTTAYAPQLFQTRNLLAVHSSYWKDYARALGWLNVDIQKDKEKSDYAITLQKDEELLVIEGDGELALFSRKPLISGQGVHLRDGSVIWISDLSSQMWTSELYRYTYALRNENGEKIAYPTGSIKLARLLPGTGMEYMTWDSGCYEDGWLTNNATFTIQTKDEDTLTLFFVYPQELRENSWMQITANGQITQVPIQHNQFTVTIPTTAYTDIAIKVETNLKIQNDNGDVRPLAVRMENIEHQKDAVTGYDAWVQEIPES